MDARRFTRPVYRELAGVVKVHGARERGREGEGGCGCRVSGRERGAAAIRESAATSGGSVDPAAKVRRYRVDLCDVEGTDVRIRQDERGMFRDPLFLFLSLSLILERERERESPFSSRAENGPRTVERASNETSS